MGDQYNDWLGEKTCCMQIWCCWCSSWRSNMTAGCSVHFPPPLVLHFCSNVDFFHCLCTYHPHLSAFPPMWGYENKDWLMFLKLNTRVVLVAFIVNAILKMATRGRCRQKEWMESHLFTSLFFYWPDVPSNSHNVKRCSLNQLWFFFSRKLKLFFWRFINENVESFTETFLLRSYAIPDTRPITYALPERDSCFS